MDDMNVDFLGGELNGQQHASISHDELKILGYRSALNENFGKSALPMCIAVPIDWTPEKAHEAIKEKFGLESRKKPGERSI